MRLRSGRVKGEVAKSACKKRVEINKISHLSHSKNPKYHQRKLQKVVSQSEIKKIIENSKKLIVQIKRMDTRETVNDKTTQPQGEENSENSNRTTNNNDDDGEEDGARGGVDLQPNAQFDIQTIQQALTAPLPEYDERREREPQQQQTQQQQI